MTDAEVRRRLAEMMERNQVHLHGPCSVPICALREAHANG